MSRAFTPPDTLSKEDFRAIADVRREIWTNGFKGMGIGGLAGFVGHAAAQAADRRGLWSKSLPLNRNTAFVSVMLGASITSYAMAVTAGKNEVHNLHPIYQAGSKPTE